jgi:hypothetical protein
MDVRYPRRSPSSLPVAKISARSLGFRGAKVLYLVAPAQSGAPLRRKRAQGHPLAPDCPAGGRESARRKARTLKCPRREEWPQTAIKRHDRPDGRPNLREELPAVTKASADKPVAVMSHLVPRACHRQQPDVSDLHSLIILTGAKELPPTYLHILRPNPQRSPPRSPCVAPGPARWDTFESASHRLDSPDWPPAKIM